ncbi:MAG: pyrroline-5-carboxylate reductase [Clostridia bacterium]|nr:pyrroline-5-carboxylate reductase [Clostridia bacterium]
MNIGFIGAGNMASALAGGLIASEFVRADEIAISDKNFSALKKWQTEGVFVTENNSEVFENSEVVVFAVKPNVLPAVLEEAKAYTEGKIFISIAAGVTIDTIQSILGEKAKLVRAMPNTPAKVNCGMTVITPNKNISEAELEMARHLLSAVGEVVVLEEKYINAATALHGSSPAYVYMLIDAMADCGVKYGIPKDVALTLAAKAVEGSAKMVLESKEHPQQLKDAVCSPGGTTIAAVFALEEKGFKTAVEKAIDACVEKADEMSKK